MNRNEELAIHCKDAIEKVVNNAGGVFAFVNQLIVVADEDSTTRALDKSVYAGFALADELNNEHYYLDVHKVELKNDGSLAVDLYVSDYETDNCGEIQYANQECNVIWAADNNTPKSVMALYQIPLAAIDGMDFKQVWETFVSDKASPASCRNIIHSRATPEELNAYLSTSIRSDEPLYKFIDEERGCGATYVFVSTLQAGPIAGFEIPKLLDKS